MEAPRDYAVEPDAADAADAVGVLEADDHVHIATCKHWWHSRTIWLNVIAAGLVALEASTGLLQPLLPVNLYTAIAVGLPVINAMLRIVTNQAIRT